VENKQNLGFRNTRAERGCTFRGRGLEKTWRLTSGGRAMQRTKRKRNKPVMGAGASIKQAEGQREREKRKTVQ